MNKIEKLRAEKERRANAALEVQKEIAELEAKLESLKKDAEDAVEHGDLQQYLALTTKQEDIDREITARELWKNAMNHTDFKADAVDAWNEYVGLYNRNLSKKSREFDAAWKSLARLYMEMVGLQNDALKTRKELLALGGYDFDDSFTLTAKEEDAKYPDFYLDSMPYAASLNEGVRWNGRAWDAIPAAFIESGALPKDAAEFIRTVLEKHRYFDYHA